jgi:hypothetical protein
MYSDAEESKQRICKYGKNEGRIFCTKTAFRLYKPFLIIVYAGELE